MKRLSALLLVLILLLCASGCTKSESPVTEPPAPIQTDPPRETEPPVDESVFYFSNELEYYRLYSQRLDGTELKLVKDVHCYNVTRVGRTVFYLDVDGLWEYDIPGDVSRLLIEGVYDYKVDGTDLVYYLDTQDGSQQEIRHLDLRTGEDNLIAQISVNGGSALSGGKFYYSYYDIYYGGGELWVCDLATYEKTRIGKELISFYSLRAEPEGLYFESIDEEYNSVRYFASADGSEVSRVDEELLESCEVFYRSDEFSYGIYSTYTDDIGMKGCLHRHNSDGTVTELLWSHDDGYFIAEKLDDEHWILQDNFIEQWGPPDEFGYQENAAYRINHYVLDIHGNITPFDVAGEMGQMFAGGDFPVMDSSTARKPVTAEIYNLFVAGHGHEGPEPLCSTTHGAWLNIGDRKADIALLAAPTKEEMDYLNQRGVGIEMKLYGGDGLVFIGNAANPVQDLTHEQIIGIYQGKITNWSEVGGPDVPITVYYRDDQSGSQRLFENLVFKGLELPDYVDLGFAYMDEMSTIVDIVLEEPYSIGYSIMTYLDDVYANEGLRAFSVNGVAPCVETVKDASYPYHTQGFVVIRSDEPAGSPARRLFDWFGSPASDLLLNSCGVTPLHGESGVG